MENTKTLYLEEYRNWNGYLVARSGRIIGKFGKPLKPQKNKRGYLRVSVSPFGKHIVKLVHQIVAECFLVNPHPEKYTQINHINGNKQDPRAENLEYCTQEHNMQERYDLRRRHGLPPCPRAQSEVLRRMAYSRRKPVRYGTMVFDSIHDIARLMNVSVGTISKSVYHGKYKGLPISFLKQEG